VLRCGTFVMEIRSLRKTWDMEGLSQKQRTLLGRKSGI
jgi:hypothetical protein